MSVKSQQKILLKKAEAHFGQCLRAILVQKSLTQFRAAELLEMKQQSLGYYLNLATPPKRGKLEFIAARLEVSVAELLGGKPPTTEPTKDEWVKMILDDLLANAPVGKLLDRLETIITARQISKEAALYCLKALRQRLDAAGKKEK